MNDSPSSAFAPITILHGDDGLNIERAIQELINGMGDPGMADLNTARLDARQTSEDDLNMAVNSIPFLAPKRLVLLSNPLTKLTSENARQKFLTLLSSVPDTTQLVLIIEDVKERRDWKTMSEKHWLVQWVRAAGKRAQLRDFSLPGIEQMAAWIVKEAQNQGGKMNHDAARALADHAGNDTRLASLEVQKLLAYVDYKRPVEMEDVQEICINVNQANVFDMVEALAQGNAPQATRLIHTLLEEQDPLSLFGMIVRQFRQLIQVRDCLDQNLANRVAIELGMASPWLVDKLIAQAKRFSMPQLEEIYHRLLDIDEMAKSSQITWELAFDLFAASLARPESGAARRRS